MLKTARLFEPKISHDLREQKINRWAMRIALEMEAADSLTSANQEHTTHEVFPFAKANKTCSEMYGAEPLRLQRAEQLDRLEATPTTFLLSVVA
ncbi:hypothetical protein [Citrobacter sp. FDAARGOS_156]|uniref:hypothetical protein n=1 Tax=Citrobacter sp. FDAARGOS_156 TaxID=1702170 RepID=UPI000AFBDF88|nr:hypothetical protein [Citrobacter sp. FDAARGOS_156]